MLMQNEYFITGNSVGLRGMIRDDLPVYRQWLANEKVNQYLEMGWKPLADIELEAVYKEATESQITVVFVVCDLETNKPVGTTGLYLIHWPGRRAQFRILLGEPGCYNRGFGTEVTRLVVDYGFNILNLETIYLGTNAENQGALKCYENAGFIREGVNRKFVYRNGRYYDSVMMSVIREDWQSSVQD